VACIVPAMRHCRRRGCHLIAPICPELQHRPADQYGRWLSQWSGLCRGLKSNSDQSRETARRAPQSVCAECARVFSVRRC
jgi:hypothetical protein